MKLLAINSAFIESNLAYSDEKGAKYNKLDSSLKHSENLLSAIEDILGPTKVNDLDYIGIVIGPGSFTGIRIGLALAKAFMTVNPKIKAVPINSLELLAFSFIERQKIENDFWCILNALSGNYFVAKFDEKGHNIINPELINESEYKKLSGTIVGLCGEKLSKNETNFSSELLLKLMEEKISSNEVCDEKNLLPLYLRLSQAEQALKEKNGNS